MHWSFAVQLYPGIRFVVGAGAALLFLQVVNYAADFNEPTGHVYKSALSPVATQDFIANSLHLVVIVLLVRTIDVAIAQ